MERVAFAKKVLDAGLSPNTTKLNPSQLHIISFYF